MVVSAEQRGRFQFSIAELLTVTAVVSGLLAPCGIRGNGEQFFRMISFGSLLLFVVGGGVGRVVSEKKTGWVTGTVSAFFWTLVLSPTLGALVVAALVAAGMDDGRSFRVIVVACAVASACWGGYLGGIVERESRRSVLP